MSDWETDPETGFMIRASGSAPSVPEVMQPASPAEPMAEPEDVREQVIREKGLTPAQAKRLQGSTREELEADADEVQRIFPTVPERRIWGDVGQGASRGSNPPRLPPLEALSDHRVFMANKEAILAAAQDPYSEYNRGY